MNRRGIAAVLLLAAVVSGCNTLGRASRVDPASASVRPAIGMEDPDCPLTRDLDGDKKFAIDLNCFKFFRGDDLTAYQLATGTPNTAAARAAAEGSPPAPATGEILSGNARNLESITPASARIARNRLESVLVDHANTICEREKGLIFGSRAAASTTFDFFSSAFSGASTIVGGEQAKSILGGLAGLSTATRSNVDANIYQNQLTAAITKVMDAERKRILDLMVPRRSQGIDEYTADEMIRWTNEYHQACSFQKGIQLLLDAAVNKEGIDAIVSAMNLRQRLLFLDQRIARMTEELQEKGVENIAEDDFLEKLWEQRAQIELQLLSVGGGAAATMPQIADPPAAPAAGQQEEM